MKYNIKPTGNKVYLKQEREVKTKAGIIIASAAQEKQSNACVIAVGDEVSFVKPGDNVLIDKFGGQIIEDGETEVYLVVAEEEILGIIE